MGSRQRAGRLQAFANTAATGLDIEDGRIKGVETSRGYIETSTVVVCAGLWGRLIAAMAGEDLPIMPVDHPLTFFGPYDEFAGTGKDIGYPLLRDHHQRCPCPASSRSRPTQRQRRPREGCSECRQAEPRSCSTLPTPSLT